MLTKHFGECFKPNAMVLTESGWKTLEDVNVGENVLTLNTSTNDIEIQPILRKVVKDWDGDLIRIHNMNINDEVTPNHEYLLYDDESNAYKGKFTASDIMEGKVPRQNHSYIPRKGNWIGRNDEFFTIPNVSYSDGFKQDSLKEKYDSDLKIPMNTFAKFMGIYLSEGHCSKDERGSLVCITQKKKAVVDDIKSLMDELGLKYVMKEKPKTEQSTIPTYMFIIYDLRLCKYLQQFGKCYEKFIPFELKQQNKEILRLFYDWFVKGDGRIRGDQRDESKKDKLTDDVFSTSKRMVLDLNEIQLKIGYARKLSRGK